MIFIEYTEVIHLYKRYLDKYSKLFTFHEKNLSDELFNKLNDLRDISNEIIQIINEIASVNKITPGLDGTDIVSIGPFKLTLKRADPNIRIELSNSTIGYSSQSLDSEFINSDMKQKERKLKRLSIEFYRNADRITHIAILLPKLNRFKVNNIRIIRNNLIEHPEGGNSGVTLDSFAYSIIEGPYIKGTRVGKYTNFMDRGFRINSEEFIKLFIQILSDIL